MTGRYDFGIYDVKILTNQLMINKMVRDTGFEPVTPTVSR
jgi:hypothetical protein